MAKSTFFFIQNKKQNQSNKLQKKYYYDSFTQSMKMDNQSLIKPLLKDNQYSAADQEMKAFDYYETDNNLFKSRSISPTKGYFKDYFPSNKGFEDSAFILPRKAYPEVSSDTDSQKYHRHDKVALIPKNRDFSSNMINNIPPLSNLTEFPTFEIEKATLTEDKFGLTRLGQK